MSPMSSESRAVEESKAISAQADSAMEAEKHRRFRTAWSDVGSLDVKVSRYAKILYYDNFLLFI